MTRIDERELILANVAFNAKHFNIYFDWLRLWRQIGKNLDIKIHETLVSLNSDAIQIQ